MKYLTDLGLLYRRNVIATLRNPVWAILGLFQPILYLLLFAPLLGSLSNVPGFPRGGAFTVFTPGLLVMLALFGTAYVGFGLVAQIRSGVVERLLVTPASRSAILLGYVLRDITTLLVQSAILVAIALPMGLSVSVPGLAVTFAMMVLSGILMSSCSYALALRLKSEDSIASVLNTLTAPILLLSGITLPLTLAPKIIRSIASVNPFAYEVTAARSLFLGNFGDSSILVGILFLGGLAALAFFWAARSFRKGTV
jgi:ABC-2 type transport system permease protein